MLLAILGSPTSWYVNELRRVAQDRHDVVCFTFSELGSAVSSSEFRVTADGARLEEIDCLHVRTMSAASLEQVIFRMDLLWQLEARGVRVVNPPGAVEAAVDKYLATARLQAAELPVPPTVVCQNVDHAMAAFAELGQDVVVKPLFGAEGRGMSRITDEDIAWRTFKTLAELRSVLYLQQFIPHDGFDTRVLVIGDKQYAMRRENSGNWRTNAARGADCKPCELTPDIADLAQRAAAAVGASLAGVDILEDSAGKRYVLEVNAVPGWQALARTLDVDISAEVLDHLLRQPTDREMSARSK
ncbi:MAG: RimK family alpha-L-glutamate ligase [Pirellulales bacterium]|nr:RimK family alpha-L-glutamate ligase [Pirellulales bacterium]